MDWDTYMFKRSLGLIPLFTISSLAIGADPLHGTKWKTIDDKAQKAVSVVQFTETSNGVLSAKIIEILNPNDVAKCVDCTGKFQNKPLQGLQIVSGLQKVDKNSYDNGKIIDPKNGKTYSFNAKLSADGQTLSGRGYIGISALGRGQTWVRTQ